MYEPIKKSYTFPGVEVPFRHQILTTDFIVENPKCFVFNDIGTGKTWSVAWAIDVLFKAHDISKVLIVAPLSTLDIVWRRTFFHLDSTLTVNVLKGSASKKLDSCYQKPFDNRHIVVVNPDSLHIIASDKKAYQNFDMVVVDESAMFRKQSSRRGKALKTICEKVSRIVCMTGSPTPEAPTDVWFTSKLITPETTPKYFGQFRDLTMRKISQFKWVPLPDAQDRISSMLKGKVIRFKRDECLDLPPTQYVTNEVEPTVEQLKLLKELRDEAAVGLTDGTIDAGNEAVIISKMLQICSGAVKYSDDEVRNSKVLVVDCKPKFDALDDLIEASDKPIILFSNFTAVIDVICQYLASKKIVHGRVDGSTGTQQRLNEFDALQAGQLTVLVAHPRAMAHGITLTTSNIVCWWTPDFSHEIYEQANGRITRPGQVSKTYITHLVCSNLEKKVLKRVQEKKAMQGILLEYLTSSEGR